MKSKEFIAIVRKDSEDYYYEYLENGEMKKIISKKHNHKELESKEYNVSVNNIHHIIKRKNWAHI